LEERLKIAREINEYREMHSDMMLAEVLKAFPNVTESNYWAWRKRLELADATRKANGEKRVHVETQSFPLMPFEHPTKAPVKRGPYKTSASAPDDNKVAALLEALAAVLRR